MQPAEILDCHLDHDSLSGLHPFKSPVSSSAPTSPSSACMRWTLLKDTAKLKSEAAADPDALIAKMIRTLLEAINGLFQAAKRHARGFTCIATIRTVNVLDQSANTT